MQISRENACHFEIYILHFTSKFGQFFKELNCHPGDTVYSRIICPTNKPAKVASTTVPKNQVRAMK